jgi:hypothetical protein
VPALYHAYNSKVAGAKSECLRLAQ